MFPAFRIVVIEFSLVLEENYFFPPASPFDPIDCQVNCQNLILTTHAFIPLDAHTHSACVRVVVVLVVVVVVVVCVCVCSVGS